jgi:5-hydroxyisourate hydrolase
VKVELARDAGSGAWQQVGEALTDARGRIEDLASGTLTAGIYRLRFDTDAYFTTSGGRAFFPLVEICFRVDAPFEHHHVPLLLSPFGYSTYRGG